MKTLGEIITQYMKEHDLSLRDFADKAKISHTYVGKLQKGVDPRSNKPIEPTLDVIEKIAAAMNITLEEILNLLGKTSFKNFNNAGATVALHRDDGYNEDLPEEAKQEIENFKEFIRAKYGKKK